MPLYSAQLALTLGRNPPQISDEVMMTTPNRTLIRRYRQLAVLGSLAFATAICLVLLAARVLYSDSRMYGFLAWNLFLAWLPLLCSLAVYNAYTRGGRLSWLVVAGCALAWLVFFPNAPSILTVVMPLRPPAAP